MSSKTESCMSWPQIEESLKRDKPCGEIKIGPKIQTLEEQTPTLEPGNCLHTIKILMSGLKLLIFEDLYFT